MLSLYEILKASKTGIAPDMWTRLAAEKMAGVGGKVRELTGELPLTFRSNGKPLIDYTIYGNMTQSKECGERTKNLFDKDNVVFSGFYPHADTGAVVNTTSGKLLSIIVPCEPNTSYAWSFDRIVADLRNRVAGYSAYPTVGMACTFLDKEPDPQSGSTRAIQKFTTTANTHWLILMVTGTGQTAETLTEDVAENAQLEIGTEALPYEKFGYKIPITSAGQTTNIYLGEVQTTRKIKKLVLDGTENWVAQAAQGGSRFVLLIQNAIASDTSHVNSICSHFPLLESGGTWIYSSGYTVTNSSIYLRYDPIATVEDFKAFLAQQYSAGTPVTVWYVLANEETGIVNEPIRKIGNYADCISMEQAGVSIPTLNGQTVVDVDTALKPSKMYIKYKE